MCPPAPDLDRLADRCPALPDRIRAVTLDIDSVLTNLSRIQAAAWASVLDGYLVDRRHDMQVRLSGPAAELDRLVGDLPATHAASVFLESRGVEFPDACTAQRTAKALAGHQQAVVDALLRRYGVGIRHGAAELLHGLRDKGIAVAAVSATARARRLLDTGQLVRLVDVVLDGDDRNRLRLPPRPDPALLLRAARMLRVRPDEAAVVDTSPSGIRAARRGGFGRIIGITAPGDLDSLTDLFRQGADFIVHDLGELLDAPHPVTVNV